MLAYVETDVVIRLEGLQGRLMTALGIIVASIDQQLNLRAFQLISKTNSSLPDTCRGVDSTYLDMVLGQIVLFRSCPCNRTLALNCYSMGGGRIKVGTAFASCKFNASHSCNNPRSSKTRSISATL